MKRIGLAMQIFIGLILGIIVGAIFYGSPEVVKFLQPIGDIFIRLIKMIIVPIVISTLIIGIAGIGDMKKFGRLGGKSILYFEIVTTIALMLGLLAANIVQPGAGLDVHELNQADVSKHMDNAAELENKGGIVSIIVNIVPTNIIDALARGDMLAIIFFSILFGLGIASIGEKGEPVLRFFQGVADTMFWVTNQIMKFAPFGVFALIGVTVSKFGLTSLIPLGKLILTAYAIMILFVVVVFGILLKMSGTNLITLIKVLKDELILAFSTASSETVLPRLMEKMEKFGCKKEVTSFVIPVGYSFNLDGGALYQSLAVLFIAQMYNIDMSISQQIMVLVVLMFTTKGLAGVPGANFSVLLATLGSVGLPLEGIAFIAGVDRIIDMGRTAVNVMGNAVATIVLAKWEGQFDLNKAKSYVHTIASVPSANRTA
ncbi:cation:dicarboxylase symporter family transporter [Bacillus sp. FJAT-49705]|uniref:Cation:dicarboxylase symporter family transporter n=1 Tax=Cytobacillus citreus TaxID=2833586 RepID=A0ABS5NRU9_9BACI|nr:cation:dicarboxylase symporter family transporter [Cytobacillus citreus]MBS4190178.1 cation:dicarboxylase symporter family transporter [Cytobacillus citreus]